MRYIIRKMRELRREKVKRYKRFIDMLFNKFEFRFNKIKDDIKVRVNKEERIITNFNIMFIAIREAEF